MDDVAIALPASLFVKILNIIHQNLVSKLEAYCVLGHYVCLCERDRLALFPPV